jgi:hypothetical protein
MDDTIVRRETLRRDKNLIRVEFFLLLWQYLGHQSLQGSSSPSSQVGRWVGLELPRRRGNLS